MSLIFKPNGLLNIATEATDLPQIGDGTSFASDALTRCKNLRVDQTGVLKTRDGSSKFNTSAINTAIWLLIEQAGNRYSFAGANIYKDESSIASGLTSAQWSGIKYNAFNDTTNQIYALNGTDRKRIQDTTVTEWGIEPPTVAPTLAVGALGGLTGDYNVRYTYARKVGATVVSESDPSPAGTAATLSNESLSVTWTASSDSQVTHVRVYRTLTSGATYFHDQDIAIGTVTVDTDTTDAGLGTEVATDHDRPPLGSHVSGPTYNGTCFIIKDNLLYYCKPKQPEYWPLLYNIEVSITQDPGQVLVFHNGQPYVLTKNEIFYIQGTGHGTFFPLPMKARAGAQGLFGAISVHGHGIYHVGSDGLYLYSGTDEKITQNNLDPIFRGETVNGLPGVTDLNTAWLHQHKNSLYFGYTSSGNTYPTNVIIFNLTSKRIAYYLYNDGSDIEIRCIETDKTNNKLIVGDNTGFVREIEQTSQTTDTSTAISWEAQGKDFTLQTRANFPRWVKYDVDASSTTTCTGELLLDGVSHQSHTVTGNRKTRRRLVDTGNGERVSHKISGSGPVSFYAIESE